MEKHCNQNHMSRGSAYLPWICVLEMSWIWSIVNTRHLVITWHHTSLHLITWTSDVKLDFFSKSKLESKKSIKTRNLFLIVSEQHGEESKNKYV